MSDIKHAIRNGEVIREDAALVPITKREVQCNFSVYEALRVLHGCVVHLEDHIARLEESARQLRLVIPSVDYLSWINKLIEADGLGDATMRILVIGGAEPDIFITWSALLSYPDSYYSEGIAVTTYEGERFLPTCKTSNLLLSYLALEDAKAKGGFEALLVDRRGKVLEGTRSNFYALFKDKLYTAPDEEVLSGITRISVIRAAKQLGLEVVFSAPDIDSLSAADALFISSTSMAAMPISKLNEEMVKCDFATVLKIKELVRSWELE